MAGQRQWGWLGVALALITGGAGVAQAQPNPFLANVRHQLLEAAWAAQQEGYRLSHEPLTGRLRPWESELIAVTLRAGVNYIIVAVCDQDCGDIDLRLFDENRKFIDEDMDSDAVPVVSVTPAHEALCRPRMFLRSGVFAC